MNDAPAVSAMFEHLQNCLPVFVPVLPSLKCATAVGGIVLLLGLLVVRHVYYRFANAASDIDQQAWIVALLVVLYVTQLVFGTVKRKHYTFRSVAQNQQHYANLHWIKEYKEALGR
tara:strand:- start:1988 stop:2335 length:348 start_codon:yes stop_codon:yes gene_type:complete